MNHTTAYRKRREIDWEFPTWLLYQHPETLRQVALEYCCKHKSSNNELENLELNDKRIVQFLSIEHEVIYRDLYGDWLESPQLRDHLVNLINQQNR